MKGWTHALNKPLDTNKTKDTILLALVKSLPPAAGVTIIACTAIKAGVDGMITLTALVILSGLGGYGIAHLLMPKKQNKQKEE